MQFVVLQVFLVFLALLLGGCGFEVLKLDGQSAEKLQISCVIQERNFKSPNNINYCYKITHFIKQNSYYHNLDGKLDIVILPSKNFYIQTQAFATFLQLNFDTKIKYSNADKSFTDEINIRNFNETMAQEMATEFASQNMLADRILQNLSDAIVKEILLRK